MSKMENSQNIQEIKPSKAPLVLGVISLFAWLLPIVGLVVSIVGIVVSAMNLKIQKLKAYKIGLTLNIIGLVITIGYFIFSVYVVFNILNSV